MLTAGNSMLEPSASLVFHSIIQSSTFFLKEVSDKTEKHY